MKVIKTLSIINFFIFVTFNIKNESKYSNTLINNAYNMNIRRSMANEGSDTATPTVGTPGEGTPAAGATSDAKAQTTGTAPNNNNQTVSDGTTTQSSASDKAQEGEQTSKVNDPTSQENPKKGETESTQDSTQQTQNPVPQNEPPQNPAAPAETSEKTAAPAENVKETAEPADNVKETAAPAETSEETVPPAAKADNPTPAAEQAESPELQSVQENKAPEKHGHMHGSRNNHPQNPSESQKECTDGNKENCGAEASLLNNSSNIASINKFVALISATLVLSFAIFI